MSEKVLVVLRGGLVESVVSENCEFEFIYVDLDDEDVMNAEWADEITRLVVSVRRQLGDNLAWQIIETVVCLSEEDWLVRNKA
jgi:hypothetical protein